MIDSRQRAFSLIEGLMAALVLGTAITGSFVAWSAIDIRFGRTREVALAGQLSRAEIERAKVYGIPNLPLGTYSSTTKTATWSGVYDPTAASGAGAWTSGKTSYYDINGTRLTSATGAILSLQDSFTDSNVLPSGSTYSYQLQSEKAMVVTLKRLGDNSTLLVDGTNIVSGGI